MIEQKLALASESLPTPQTDFASIVHTADLLTAPQAASPRWKRAIALIVVLVLLGGCAAGAVTYTYAAGPTWYNSYEDAVKLSARINVLVPESLNEKSPFYDVTTIHTTTQNRFWMLSWFFYRYKTVALQYGTEGTYVNDEGTTGYTIFDNVYFQFGSTENELWRDIFPFNDDGIWCHEELDPSTYASTNYKDFQLQSGTLVRPWVRMNTIIWIDRELNVCFMISSSDYTTDELLVFAKEIVDLNHPD